MIIGIASADYLRADRAGTEEDLWGGAGWARMGQYVAPYRALGHTVVVGTLWGGLDAPLVIEEANGNKTEPDVVLMQRIMHEQVADVMRSGRSHGQVVINDLDDWYWGLDPSNQAFKASHPKHNPNENVKFYGANLAASSLLTVSTPYLAERISRRVKCPIVVVPNYIDVTRFTPVVQSLEVPIFGWAGSTGHRSGDIETIAGVFRGPIDRGDIKFHHAGDHFSSPPLFQMMGVAPEQITRAERTNAQDYPSLLTFDVGIVPLRDTPFNYAKSDIKGLEYAASGIPFIAQDSPAYQNLWRDWDGAFHLASRPKDWVAGIKRYQSYDKRIEDQERLLDFVKRRDVEYGIKKWTDVLQGATP